MHHQITLHQRSEAESLLMEFTLDQMTRNYWGEFAGSRTASRTRLWIETHHGKEAYLADLVRLGGGLRMCHCQW